MVDEPRHPFVPYRPVRLPAEVSLRRGRSLFESMSARRSVRQFSAEPVPREGLELAIRTAGTAPSAACCQPWKFVVVDDPAIKLRIRVAAEQEERRSCEAGRVSDEWHEALAPLGGDWHKPYLETAPCLVIVFEQTEGTFANGRPRRHHHVRESVGLACGLFLAALHQMGLCTLAHAPSPMGLLREILGRPKTERPFILFPVGYPAADAEVPDLQRKPLGELVSWNAGKPTDGNPAGSNDDAFGEQE
jgi:iodotyrosine deiodinase